VQSQPLVSIIIPTYNRERCIARSINSVLSQTYQNWELIIVDDRSTDNTKMLIEQYEKRDSRIRYIPNTHKKGPAGARNQGLEITKGEFIAFLDSDDEWRNYHIEEIICEFNNNPDIDWIFADGERSCDGEIIKKSILNEAWADKNRFIVEKRKNLLVFSEKKLLTNALKYYINVVTQVSVMRKEIFAKISF
jgi:glycosyltransferase involved in cell wall biosynthesis